MKVVWREPSLEKDLFSISESLVSRQKTFGIASLFVLR